MNPGTMTATCWPQAVRGGATLACLLLAGCASAPPSATSPLPTGTGSYKPVHGADTRRYVLSAGEAFSGATLARFENPQYPPSLLALKLAPVTLVVQLVIGADGRVQRVQPDPPAQLQLIDHAAEFMAAIAACTRQWQFAPLVISTQHELDGRTISSRSARPFSLVYAFTFELRDGKAHASLARQ
ncbi:hypothetical protein [Metallibacterium scheffleri]|nr:hypothetical protein [Metallibacterium scheffleri]